MKRRSLVIWIMVASLVVLLYLVEPPPLEFIYRPPYKSVLFAGSSLTLTRAEIKRFHDQFGRNPHSLQELAENEQARDDPWEASFYELLSNSRGNCTEHNIQDGTGGWYYNESTGEVRVNLDRPVRSYLYGYFGEAGGQIPANW